MPTVGNVGGFPGNAGRSGGFAPGGIYQGPYGQLGFIDVSAVQTGPQALVVPPAPPVSTLTDDFTTADGNKWAGYGANPSVVSGRLSIACTAAFPNITSVNRFDLRNSILSIEVPQLPNVGAGSTSARLEANIDANNSVAIFWEAGTLYASYKLNGTVNNVGTTYNASAHLIWRIRESGGQIYWETSQSGVAWASLRASIATPVPVASVAVVLNSGYWGTETTPGTALFDNLNATYADPPPAPRVFYVDPAGSNTNDGLSTGAPWATVAKVTNTLLYPGDQVLFKRGGTWSGNLVVSGSGMPNSPITISAYGTGTLPIISGGGSSGTAGATRPCEVFGSFVVIDSLELRGASDVGVFVNGTDCAVQNCIVRWGAYGIEQTAQAARIDILYNTIIDVNVGVIGAGVNDDTGAQAVLLYGDSAEVAYNTISGSYYTSPDYGLDGSAIEIYDTTNAVVHHNTASECVVFAEMGGTASLNNVFYDNVFVCTLGGSNGFTVHGANYIDNSPNPFGPVQGTRVYHNTIVLTNTTTGGVGIWVSPNGEVDCQNNIFSVAGSSSMASLYPTNRTITEAGNVFWNTSGNTGNYVMPTGSIDATSTIADPLFVNPPTDLHLQVGSPAIDRGADLGYTTDIAGNPRNQNAAPDAGAYEGAIVVANGAVAMTTTHTLTSNATVTATQQGAIAMTATHTLTPNGVATKVANASMTAAETLTVAGVSERVASVAMTAAETTTANGVTARVAAASMTATETTTANGVSERIATVAMTTTETMTVDGVVTRVATVNMTATETTTANGVSERVAVVTMASTEILTVAGVSERVATVAMTATETTTANGVAERVAVVTMIATETTTIDGIVTRLGVVSMSATHTLTSNAAVGVTVSLVATHTLTANAVPERFALVAATAAHTLTVAGVAERVAAVAMTTIETTTANGTRIQPAVVAITAIHTLVSDGTAVRIAASSMTATHTLSVAGYVERFAIVSMVATQTVTANGVTERVAVVSMTGTHTLVSTAWLQIVGVGSMSATDTLSALGSLTEVAVVAMTATDTLSASAGQNGAVAMTATHTLTMSAQLVEVGAVAITSTHTLTNTVIVQAFGAVAMTVTHTLTVNGVVTRVATVSMVATHTTLASAVLTVVAVVSMVATHTTTANATGFATVSGTAALAATHTMLISPSVTMSATVLISSLHALLSDGTAIRVASVPLTGVSVLTVDARTIKAGLVALVATHSMGTAGTLTARAIVAMIAYATLIVTVQGTIVWVRHPTTGLFVKASVMVRNPARGNAFEDVEVMVRHPVLGQFVPVR